MNAMRTLTLDVLNDKAINLLKDLEDLKVIKLHEDAEIHAKNPKNLAAKYSGAMTKQSIEEIEKQLNDLRAEWD